MIFKVVLDKKIHLLKLHQKASIEDLKRSVAQAYQLQPSTFTLCYVDDEGDDITLNDQHDYAIMTSSDLKTMKIKVYLSENMVSEPQDEEEENLKRQNAELSNNFKELMLQEKGKKIEEPSFVVEESMIEEKLKKLLPELISKVKTEIEEEQSERSRIYDENQPLIVEEKAPILKAQPVTESPKEQVMSSEEDKRVIHKGYTCDGCGVNDIEGIRYKCAVCADFDFCEKCQSSIEHVHPFLKIRTLKQAPIKIIAVIKDEENNFEINGHKIPSGAGFEQLLNRGMDFLSNMSPIWGQAAQQRNGQCRRQPGPGCGFLRNFMQNNFQGFQQKQEQKQNEPKEKEEGKMKAEESEPTEDDVLDKAQFLSQYGFEFNKCYQWAKTYPLFPKEALLDFCLSSPGFLE